MSKRKTMDKAQARERRNRLLESAAAAELSLTEGVREMRAISGMTQEEFARHREVSARVIKALELSQGNPTVATLNRIGEFFGLEVGFVPIKRAPSATTGPQPTDDLTVLHSVPLSDKPGEGKTQRSYSTHVQLKEFTTADTKWEVETVRDMQRRIFETLEKLDSMLHALPGHDTGEKNASKDADATDKRARTQTKKRSP